MSKEVVYGSIIFEMLMGLLIGFLLIIVLDSYTSKKRKKIFAVIILLMFILVLQNLISCYLTIYVTARTWRTLVSVIGYSVRPAIIVMFAYLFMPERKHYIAWGVVAFNAVMHCTAFFKNIVFVIDSQNRYVGGPLKSLCLVVSLVLLAYLAALGFLSYKDKKFGTKEIIFHFFWISVVIIGIIADMLWSSDTQWIDYLTIAVVIASVFSYIWLHQRFVADYEAALMAEQRFDMMLTQIQPHFIYNSLSAIAEIDGVPENAQKAIVDFSDYLRENLDSMTTAELIPFDKELKHIKKYIDLEILRFGDKVKVVFNLSVTDFLLPVMTVQMLVENAIKHGITKKHEGGTVIVSTKKDGKNVIVTVTDDGVGFDAEKEITGNHIGLNNIRKRLEYTVGGRLEIVSEKGKGTTATLIVPYDRKEKQV